MRQQQDTAASACAKFPVSRVKPFIVASNQTRLLLFFSLVLFQSQRWICWEDFYMPSFLLAFSPKMDVYVQSFSMHMLLLLFVVLTDTC